MKIVIYICIVFFCYSCIQNEQEDSDADFISHKQIELVDKEIDNRKDVSYKVNDSYDSYDSKGNYQLLFFSDLQDNKEIIKDSNLYSDENKAYDNIFFGISPNEYKSLVNNYMVKVGNKYYPISPSFYDGKLYEISIPIPGNDLSFILNILEKKFGKTPYNKKMHEHAMFTDFYSDGYSWTTKTKKIVFAHYPDPIYSIGISKHQSLFHKNPTIGYLTITNVLLSEEKERTDIISEKLLEKDVEKDVENMSDKF